MEQWNHIPLVIRQKLILTFLTGAGCFFITAACSIAFHDRLLLYLGLAVTAGCLFRGKSLWNMIRLGTYEAITGTCVEISYPRLRSYKRIKLADENNVEGYLLLDRRTRVVVGTCYCFYFQKRDGILPGSEYLNTSLSAGSFLGHERRKN